MLSSPVVEPRFWRETRLRLEHARQPPRPTGAPVGAPLAPAREVLHHLCALSCGRVPVYHPSARGWRRIWRRTCPSAGALYPLEVLALLPGSGRILVYEPAADRLRRWAPERAEPDRGEWGEEALGAMGLAISEGAALLLFLARPWRSTVKYGQRGYLYSLLDVGHAVSNAALYLESLEHELGAAGSRNMSARAAGIPSLVPPTVLLRFDRSELSRRLGLAELCREPVAAVAVPGLGGPAPALEEALLEEEEPQKGWSSASWPSPLEPPGPAEREDWAQRELLLPPWPSAGPRASAWSRTQPRETTRQAEISRRPETAGAALPLPEPPPRAKGAASLAALIRRRRSASGFLDRALTATELSALLTGLRDPGPRTDGPEAARRLELVLIPRCAAGLSGAHRYDPRRHALLPLSPTARSGIDLRPACMGQEVAEHAAALVLFTAPLRSRLRRADSRDARQALVEIHYQAASLGQRLYLAATEHGLGVTCLGGFDEVECARLAPLTEGEETVYAALIGHPDPAATKHDRLAIAWSHGMREANDA